MKRLILLSILLIVHSLYADTLLQESVANQSSPNSDDASISISNIHHINLDNTDIDSGGNWFNKRIWYTRSQTVFDEVRVLVSTVTDLRIQFANEVNAIGQKIDTFFETVNFTQGELDDKFKEMLAALDTKQKIIGDLTAEERTLQASIKENISLVNQIEKDIKSIGEIDKKIDQTFFQASKTIDECRDLETKSWDAFKLIAKELDDKKARNLYYQINNYKENIDQKSKYLKSTLLLYLHNVLVAKIDKNIQAVNSSVETLKTKGFDLEKIMQKNQEDDVAELRHREKQAVEIAVKKVLEDEAEKLQIITEKAAKDLEEADKKSFSNVVHMYYDQTLGKVVHLFRPFYDWIVQQSIATYVYDTLIYCANNVYFLSNYVTRYTSSFAKTKQVETQVGNQEKVEIKTSDVPDIKKEEVLPVVRQAPQQDLKHENSQTSADSVNTLPEDKQVIVQSLHKHKAVYEDHTSANFNQIYADLLNLIQTIILSLYNCLVQFFKFLYTLSLYIRS